MLLVRTEMAPTSEPHWTSTLASFTVAPSVDDVVDTFLAAATERVGVGGGGGVVIKQPCGTDVCLLRAPLYAPPSLSLARKPTVAPSSNGIENRVVAAVVEMVAERPVGKRLSTVDEARALAH